MLDKDYQMFILQQVASVYPNMTLSLANQLRERAPGDTPNEKMQNLKENLLALQEDGYVEKAIEKSVDGKLSWNEAFSITPAGRRLVESMTEG